MEARRRRRPAEPSSLEIERAREAYARQPASESARTILADFETRLKRNEPARALLAIKAGAPLLSDEQLTNCLFWAAGDDHASAVEALLAAGARPDASNGFGHRALCRAAEAGALGAIEALAAAGADLDAGLDLGAPHAGQATFPAHPIIAAAANGQIHAIELLAGLGADLNVVDAQGRTAISAAREHGEEQAAELLGSLGARSERDELDAAAGAGPRGSGPPRV